MMTIRETVKQTLTQVAGNKPFHALELITFYPNCETDTPSKRVNRVSSIRRALRDIPYVRKLADGRYVVKGRRVPSTVASRKAVDDIPDYELADHEKPIVQHGEWY